MTDIDSIIAGLTEAQRRATDKAFPKFACYCDLEVGEEPTDCVINIDHWSSCNLATTGTGRPRRSPTGCEYWLRNTGPLKMEATNADR